MKELCQTAEMSRQAYYKWKTKVTIWGRLEAFALMLVRNMRKLMPEIGGRKIFNEIRRVLPFGRDCFFTWLKRHGLLSMRKRSFPVTTYSKHTLKKYRNLIRDFKAMAAGQVVVSDITYSAPRPWEPSEYG